MVTALAALRLRWPWWAALLAMVAAVPPLVTVPLEMWFRRIGLLSARARGASTAGLGPRYVVAKLNYRRALRGSSQDPAGNVPQWGR